MMKHHRKGEHQRCSRKLNFNNKTKFWTKAMKLYHPDPCEICAELVELGNQVSPRPTIYGHKNRIVHHHCFCGHYFFNFRKQLHRGDQKFGELLQGHHCEVRVTPVGC